MTKIGKMALWKTVALAFGIGATSWSVQAKTPRHAAKNGDILFSARFYLKPGTPKGASHFHLYRINADGSGKRQITFGAHDDEFPLWANDGKKLVWLRDDKTLLLSDENGNDATKLLDVSSSDGAYWNGLKISPKGKTCGILRSISTPSKQESRLYLVNLQTRQSRQLKDVEHYSWSRDNRFLALEGGQSGFRVLDLQTWQTRKMNLETLGRFTWISSADLVATIPKVYTEKDNPFASFMGIESFQVFNVSGKLQLIKNAKADEESSGPDSFVLPIPGATNAFTFVSDERTSSGYNATYFRVSAIDGQMTRLAEGQSFAWSRDGNRFLNVTYHDTTPYDTKPNGHKRVVYTTKLQVGASEKTLRDIVSGLVYVESADWR